MENYGKKYKKLVGALKVLRDDNPSDEGIQNWINDNVPELKESEYDRIRKEIIVYLKSKYESPHSITCDYGKWITWLEKQGEKKPVISYDALREGVVHFGITQYQIDNWLKKYVDVEKQGEQKEINLVEILKHYPRETELYSPLYGKIWLAEVDEKYEIIYCYKHPLYEGCTRAVLEQEDIVSFYPNGTTGLPDFSISKDCMLFLYDIENQGGQKCNNQFTKQQAYILDKHIDKFLEEKSVDKVEPKFKVGDWIVSNVSHEDYRICKILKIENGEYVIESIYGYQGHNNFETFDNDYQLWTIQDANDGDVLYDGTTIFIFKDLLSDGSVMSYCDYDTDSGESDAFCPLSVNLMCSKITPATKEHRDLLFQKMHEAGYEWDAEKKELKKIEQGHAWSEEDDRNLSIAIQYVFQHGYLSTVDWLKSLKDRYTWKPSEEQMSTLENVIKHLDYIKAESYKIVLKELFEQLKKL